MVGGFWDWVDGQVGKEFALCCDGALLCQKQTCMLMSFHYVRMYSIHLRLFIE